MGIQANTITNFSAKKLVTAKMWLTVYEFKAEVTITSAFSGDYLNISAIVKWIPKYICNLNELMIKYILLENLTLTGIVGVFN